MTSMNHQLIHMLLTSSQRPSLANQFIPRFMNGPPTPTKQCHFVLIPDNAMSSPRRRGRFSSVGGAAMGVSMREGGRQNSQASPPTPTHAPAPGLHHLGSSSTIASNSSHSSRYQRYRQFFMATYRTRRTELNFRRHG